MAEVAPPFKVIFNAARALRPNERAAYLNQACGGDLELRRKVDDLLAALDDAGSFLESPTLPRPRNGGGGGGGEAPTVSLAAGVSELPGAVIGRYKLLQLIGEGGFGRVYMAEQTEPVVRKVALKIIKLGMDTRQVIARFEAERQALAMMDHPNIAKVLDAGATPEGRPYFVMELVKGDPITDYCDRNNLSVEERLELFSQVCRAVQHAHQKGIIHRDIKPSNVLITIADGKPVPKVIDFGIAKATNARLTEKTLFTEFRQLIGTPQYMSPEQAEATGIDIDTRSDIYSLGVLLYELLTGTTPFDALRLRSAAFGEIQRIIREEEPQRPSTRISTLDTLPTVAAHRRAEPRKLSTIIRGDLDWIVMKCLEKDRTRRYETADSLALDIKRHIDNEPVQAGPPSAGYRMRKFVRRNRKTVTAAILLLSVLLLGVIGTTAGLYWAVSEREKSQLAEQSAIDQRIVAQANEARAQQESERAERVATEARFREYAANLEAATAALEAHDIASARFRLQLAAPEFRDWEWEHLNSRLDHSTRTITGPKLGRAAYDPSAHDAQFSPDGTRIAVAFDKQLWILDRSSGNLLHALQGHGWDVVVISWSPDSNLLVTAGGEDGSVRCWHTATGKPKWVLSNLGWTVEAAGINSDGRLVATGASDGVVRLWDVETAELIAELRGHEGGICSLGFSHDNKLLVSTSHDRTVRVWDLASRRCLVSMRGHEASVLSGTFTADDREVVSGSADKTVRVWTVESGRERLRLQGYDCVRDVAISRDGALLAAAVGRIIELWELPTGTPKRTFNGHSDMLWSVAFDPEGSQLLSASRDFTAKEWDPALPADIFTLKSHFSDAHSVCFHPTEPLVVSSGRDCTIRIWDAKTGQPVAVMVDMPWETFAAQFSPDGKWLCWSHDDGTVRLTTSDTTHVRTWKAHQGRVRWTRFSPDSTLLATCSLDKTVAVWNIETGNRIAVLPHPERVSYIAFSPDGRWLASAAHDGIARLWDTQDWLEARQIAAHDDAIYVVTFSPDEKLLATASEDSSIRLWEPETGEFIRELAGHSRGIRDLAFHPNGTRLASVSRDSLVTLWDVDSGMAVLQLRGFESWVDSVQFSPDGRQLAACDNWEGLVRIWNSQPATERLSAAKAEIAARERVNPLVKNLFLQSADTNSIIETLRLHEQLDESTREAGIRAARSRAGEFDAMVQRAWSIAAQSGLPRREYELAHSTMFAMRRPFSNHPDVMSALGASSYRMGRYGNALNYLTAADESFRASETGRRPAVVYLMALCLQRTDRTAEAAEAFREAESLVKASENLESSVQALRTEAHAVFGIQN